MTVDPEELLELRVPCPADLADFIKTMREMNIAEEGGRVVSVTWQPSRTVTRAGSTASVDSGFTIVSEH